MRYVVNAVAACALAFAGCHGAGKDAPAPAASCDSTVADTAVRAIVCRPVVPESLSAGMRIIERLTLAWGKEGAAPGDFLDGPRCPDYFQGWIFRGDTLVFLVTGDTARARRELQRVGGSGDFAVEPAGGKLYSEKELNRIMDTIDRRMETAPPQVKDNVYMWSMGLSTIDVAMRLNTEAARRAFRKYVYDSPALRFSGATGQELCTETGVADTLGVSLRPTSPYFPAGAEMATFILANNGSHEVQTGNDYSIAVEHGGRWYMLPAGGVFDAIGIGVRPGGRHTFNGMLHPLVNNNRPGRYRYFKDVDIDGCKVTLMCDFFLVGD